MTTSMTKSRKAANRKKTVAKSGLGPPPAISTLEIEGKRYYLTPAADMAEWLEDLEDVVDSLEAMQDAANAIPWEEAKKNARSCRKVPDGEITMPPRYAMVILPKVHKQLAAIPKAQRERMGKAIDALASKNFMAFMGMAGMKLLCFMLLIGFYMAVWQLFFEYLFGMDLFGLEITCSRQGKSTNADHFKK